MVERGVALVKKSEGRKERISKWTRAAKSVYKCHSLVICDVDDRGGFKSLQGL